MAFERVYGPVDLGGRLDYLAAMICMTIANSNRDPKKQPARIDKFMPPWDSPEEVDLGDDS